jgi:hypothetical protein
MKTMARNWLCLLTAVCAPMGCYVQATPEAPVAEGEVVVAEAPPAPPPVVEPVPPPPSVDVVWVAGYHRWDGHRYVWERGRYARPPHARAHYVQGHWEPHRRGRVWVNAHWN